MRVKPRFAADLRSARWVPGESQGRHQSHQPAAGGANGGGHDRSGDGAASHQRRVRRRQCRHPRPGKAKTRLSPGSLVRRHPVLGELLGHPRTRPALVLVSLPSCHSHGEAPVEALGSCATTAGRVNGGRVRPASAPGSRRSPSAGLPFALEPTPSFPSIFARFFRVLLCPIIPLITH